MSILIAIFIFGVVVLVHELGHYIVAKRAGVKVEEFAMGMGPKLISRQYGETLYSLRAIPLGGFCRMLGEDAENDDPRSFGNKKVSSRIAIVSSGALFNFLLAFVIILFINMTFGYSVPVVSSVVPDSPAEAAGIQAGDRIYEINGNKIQTFDEIALEVARSQGETLEVVVKRDGEKISVPVTPAYYEGMYLIGIQCQARVGFLSQFSPALQESMQIASGTAAALASASLLEAMYTAFFRIFYFVKVTIYGFIQFFTFQLSPDQVAGPIGIISAIGTTYEKSMEVSFYYAVVNILKFTALISANLGVFNLFPIPALDGGRLSFLFLEGIRKKPIPPEKEGFIHFIGFMFLIGLAILILFNDILRIFNG